MVDEVVNKHVQRAVSSLVWMMLADPALQIFSVVVFRAVPHVGERVVLGYLVAVHGQEAHEWVTHHHHFVILPQHPFSFRDGKFHEILKSHSLAALYSRQRLQDSVQLLLRNFVVENGIRVLSEQIEVCGCAALVRYTQQNLVFLINNNVSVRHFAGLLRAGFQPSATHFSCVMEALLDAAFPRRSCGRVEAAPATVVPIEEMILLH